MKSLFSGLMATALAASFAVAVPMPAESTPMVVPKVEQGQTEVQKVNHTYRHYLRQQRRAERRYLRRQAWRDRYYDGPRYYRGDPYYYRSNRAFRPRYYRRPGVTLEFDF